MSSPTVTKTVTGMKSLADLVAATQAAGEATELNLVRRRAATLCARLEWPTPKDEEWRRTRVEAFEFDNLSQIAPAHGDKLSAGETAASDLVALERARTFLAPPAALDDDVAPRLASLDAVSAFVSVDADGVSTPRVAIAGAHALTKQGAVVAPIADIAANCAATVGAPFAMTLSQKVAGILAAALERAESSGDNRFISWNIAAWNAGVLVYVPKNAILDKPIVVDWKLASDDVAHQPLLIVIAETGSQFEVIQRFHGEGGYLVNAASHALVGENANLRLSTLQEIGDEAVWIANGHASVARDARFRHTDSTLGSGFAKTRFTADINGTGADVHLDGLYFGEENQHYDLRSVQNHNAPQATSRAFYKGVVRDKARTIYQGLILVAPHANGTDAFLTNRNLVLNDGARADSIPTLQIRTNDVRCSHGSTTGKIDPEEVFYLQNRGLSRTEAERLIVTAYMDEVANNLPALVSDHVRALVAGRIVHSA